MDFWAHLQVHLTCVLCQQKFCNKQIMCFNHPNRAASIALKCLCCWDGEPSSSVVFWELGGGFQGVLTVLPSILMGMSILMGVGLAWGRWWLLLLLRSSWKPGFPFHNSNLNFLLGLQYVNPVKFKSCLHNSHLMSDGRKSVSLN